MPELEEIVRDTLRSRPRSGPSSDEVWADVRRRIRHRKHRRRALVGAAAVVVLGAAGITVAVAAHDSDDQSRVVDAGPGPSTTAPPSDDGEVVDIPLDPTWTELDAGPISYREGYSATWTGTELIVWGGLPDDASGAAYDRVTATWTGLAPGVLEPRADHLAVWTGSELIVWGGRNEVEPGDAATYKADGAAYDPATDTWRPMATSPLPPDQYEGVWTGRELVVIGGGEAAVTGAAYDPTTDTWREIAPPPVAVVSYRLAWTGAEVLALGGEHTGEATVQQFGTWAWDPQTDTWQDRGGGSLTSQSIEATWTGDELVVWSHSPTQEGTWVLDPSGMTWSQLTGFPAECEDQIQSVATDQGVLGYFCGTFALFDPGTGNWTETPAPPGAASGTLVTTGATVFLFDAGIPVGSPNLAAGRPSSLFSLQL